MEGTLNEFCREKIALSGLSEIYVPDKPEFEYVVHNPELTLLLDCY
jgi:hypothetical protein